MSAAKWIAIGVLVFFVWLATCGMTGAGVWFYKEWQTEKTLADVRGNVREREQLIEELINERDQFKAQADRAQRRLANERRQISANDQATGDWASQRVPDAVIARVRSGAEAQHSQGAGEPDIGPGDH